MFTIFRADIYKQNKDIGFCRLHTYRLMQMKLKDWLRVYLFAFSFIQFYVINVSLASEFEIIRVSDGDTVKAESQGYEITIRLVGIDAPETSKKKNEPGQPFSQRARTLLQMLVQNKTVEIESYGLDRYSRVLGVLYVDGKNVNLVMVKEGLAEVYKGKPAPGFDNRPYWEAEREARKNMHGMWSLGDKCISPRKWRKQQKE